MQLQTAAIADVKSVLTRGHVFIHTGFHYVYVMAACLCTIELVITKIFKGKSSFYVLGQKSQRLHRAHLLSLLKYPRQKS